MVIEDKNENEFLQAQVLFKYYGSQFWIGLRNWTEVEFTDWSGLSSTRLGKPFTWVDTSWLSFGESLISEPWRINMAYVRKLYFVAK